MDNKKNCNGHKTFYIKTFKDKGKTVAKNHYKKCTVCKIRLQGFFITEKKGNACFLTSSSLITTCHQWEVKKSKDPIKYIHKSPILINNSNMLGLSGFRDENPIPNRNSSGFTFRNSYRMECSVFHMKKCHFLVSS